MSTELRGAREEAAARLNESVFRPCFSRDAFIALWETFSAPEPTVLMAAWTLRLSFPLAIAAFMLGCTTKLSRVTGVAGAHF